MPALKLMDPDTGTAYVNSYEFTVTSANFNCEDGLNNEDYDRLQIKDCYSNNMTMTPHTPITWSWHRIIHYMFVVTYYPTRHNDTWRQGPNSKSCHIFIYQLVVPPLSHFLYPQNHDLESYPYFSSPHSYNAWEIHEPSVWPLLLQGGHYMPKLCGGFCIQLELISK